MTKQTNTHNHTDTVIVGLAASATVMAKRSCTLTAQSESL